MELLRQRLDELERVVASDEQLPSLDMGQTLQQLVEALTVQWRALVARTPDVKAVLDARVAHARLLASGGPLSSEASLALLAASEGALLDTARQLAVVDAHQAYVNPPSLDALEPQRARLQGLMGEHVAQKERVVAWNAQVDALLLVHHDLMNAVSTQLLRVDALLDTLEKRKRAQITAAE